MTTMTTIPTTTTVDDLTDDELQALDDAQFHNELTQFLSELPPLDSDAEQRYTQQMNLLDQIRSEVFPTPPEPEWNHNDTFDTRYYHEYSIGS